MSDVGIPAEHTWCHNVAVVCSALVLPGMAVGVVCTQTAVEMGACCARVTAAAYAQAWIPLAALEGAHGVGLSHETVEVAASQRMDCHVLAVMLVFSAFPVPTLMHVQGHSFAFDQPSVRIQPPSGAAPAGVIEFTGEQLLHDCSSWHSAIWRAPEGSRGRCSGCQCTVAVTSQHKVCVLAACNTSSETSNRYS